MGQVEEKLSSGTSEQQCLEIDAINCTATSTIDDISLSIDGIYLTLDLPSDATDRIHQFIAEAKKEPWNGIQPRHSRFYEAGFRAYLNEVLNWEPSGASAFVCETGAKRPGAKNTAFRWNPSKCASMMVAGTVFHDYLGIPAAHLLDATVSGIDLALDIPHARVDGQAISYPKMTLTENRFSAGRTMYLGAKSGKTRIVIYDKKAEMVAANSKLGTHLGELKEPIPSHDLLRIEIRLKPSSTILLKELEALSNPFQNVRVHSRPTNLTDLEDSRFDLARYEGLPRAVSKFPPAAKKAFYRKLKKAGGPKWWVPEAAWSKQYPPLIDNFVLPLATYSA
jgi:hypothetical protein